MNGNLNLENQFKQYLERVGLVPATMSTVQYQETKRAFFGACGQMLVLLRDDVGGIADEDEAVVALEDLNNQVTSFWTNEVKKV